MESQQNTSAREAHINQCLDHWRNDHEGAYDELITILFDDLRQIAHRQLVKERANHTLQTGDLVNKLYLKLFASKTIPWRDRTHFLRSAARAMRQILIDHARSRGRRAPDKLSMDSPGVSEVLFDPMDENQIDHLLTLNEAVEKMERLDPVMAKIADFRLIFGLELREIAELVHLPLHRIKREWTVIRKMLGHHLWAQEG